MTITAAVSYGELSGMYPRAGGQYVYLKEAYNPLMGFVWLEFLSVDPNSHDSRRRSGFQPVYFYLIPAVSEKYSAVCGGFSISAAQLLAIGIILLLTYTNTWGIREGKFIQTTFTSIKLVSLFGLIIWVFAGQPQPLVGKLDHRFQRSPGNQ